MEQAKLKQLMERWQQDESFRSAVRADPRRAIADAGIELDPAEVAALAEVDWRQDDQQLEQRLAASHGQC
jgi:hypothetical protein